MALCLLFVCRLQYLEFGSLARFRKASVPFYVKALITTYSSLPVAVWVECNCGLSFPLFSLLRFDFHLACSAPNKYTRKYFEKWANTSEEKRIHFDTLYPIQYANVDARLVLALQLSSQLFLLRSILPFSYLSLLINYKTFPSAIAIECIGWGCGWVGGVYVGAVSADAKATTRLTHIIQNL